MVESNDFAVKSYNGGIGNHSIKFLCSYGGKILPRYPDGKLRYVGGDTRVLAVDRSVRFAELLVKLGEMCGCSVSLRCQLPNEDLDALVSITSDEDLANLIEEYDRANHAGTPPLKIRAFLSPPKSTKTVSPPPSATSSIGDSSAIFRSNQTSQLPYVPNHQWFQHQISITPRASYPLSFEKRGGAKLHSYVYFPQGNPRHFCLVHDENHCQ